MAKAPLGGESDSFSVGAPLASSDSLKKNKKKRDAPQVKEVQIKSSQTIRR